MSKDKKRGNREIKKKKGRPEDKKAKNKDPQRYDGKTFDVFRVPRKKTKNPN